MDKEMGVTLCVICMGFEIQSRCWNTNSEWNTVALSNTNQINLLLKVC